MSPTLLAIVHGIILDDFGPIAADVATTLVRYGRLPRSILLTKLNNARTNTTKLTTQDVSHALICLIQHHIVWHAQDKSRSGGSARPASKNPAASTGVAFYEARANEILDRAQIGTYIACAHAWFGEGGMMVASAVFANGTRTLHSLASVSPKHASYSVRNTFARMVNDRYLAAVQPEHYISQSDRNMAAEEAELAGKSMLGMPSAREIDKARMALQQREAALKSTDVVVGMKRKQQNEQEDIVVAMSSVAVTSKGRKRRTPTTATAPPDALLGSSDANMVQDTAEEDLVDLIDPTVYFRVDSARFRRRLRDEMIEGFAAERFNHAASIVVRIALEANQPAGLDFNAAVSKQFTVHQIGPMLRDSQSLLADGLYFAEDDDDYDEEQDEEENDYNFDEPVLKPKASSTSRRRKRPLAEIVQEYLELLCDAGDSSILQRAKTSHGAEYRILYDKVLTQIRAMLSEHMINTRMHDICSRRILRILAANGRMDEKQVAKMAMITPGDARRLLHNMLVLGVVGLQEVPRTADRAPSRTFYLWWTRPEMSQARSVQLCLEAILRARMRRDWERKQVAAELGKLERQDVQLDDSLLTSTEKHALAGYYERAGKLRMAEDRMWAAVSLLWEPQ